MLGRRCASRAVDAPRVRRVYRCWPRALLVDHLELPLDPLDTGRRSSRFIFKRKEGLLGGYDLDA